MPDEIDPQIESSSSATNTTANNSFRVKRKYNQATDSPLEDNQPSEPDLDLTALGLGNDLDVGDDEDYLDDEEDEEDPDNLMNDDELTSMLDSTKQARQTLKTGSVDEVAKDFAEFEDNLIATSGVGKTRHQSRQKVTKGEARLPAAVKDLLGRANLLYISQDYGKAIDLLQETITRFPNYHQPWNTLGLVHEEMGNTTKALEVRMVAAHMSGNDAGLWKELGLKSIENNANRQAIYCFDKALGVDPLDVDVLWDRAFLQKNLGLIDAAIEGYQQILEILPFHFKVINELAQLYRGKGEIKRAIALYESAMEHHIRMAKENPEQYRTNEDNNAAFSDTLGYPEINMLSELYLMLNDYRHALDCIKLGVRHVQRRQHETRWLKTSDDNDDEYLPKDSHQQDKGRRSRLKSGRERHGKQAHIRRKNTYEDDDDDADLDDAYIPDSEAEEEEDEEEEEEEDEDDVDDEEAALARQKVPLELRVRMGVCRIYLGQLDIAARHFNFLYRVSASEYSDLYQDVAYAYMDKRVYDMALTVFQKIIDSSDEVEVLLLIRTADCYREVGKLDTAVLFYVNVLDEQPENLEVMTSLAMVYEEQGKEDEALQLVDFVVQKTRELRRLKREEALAAGRKEADELPTAESTATEELAMATAERLNTNRQKGSLFDEVGIRHSVTMERELRRERRRREENARQTEALVLFEKITELNTMVPDHIVNTDRNVVREYIRVAQRLWDDFRTTNAFFPNKKKVLHDGYGFYASRKGNIKHISHSVHEARLIATRLRQRTKSQQTPAEVNVSSEDEDDEEERAEEEAKTKKMIHADHFRNISFDNWVDIIIKYSYMLTLVHRSEEAFIVLRTAIVSSVIYDNTDRKTLLKLAMLGCALVANDRSVITDVTRWFCNIYQFQNDAYNIYGMAMPSGRQDALDYAPNTTFKYFVRSIRLMDALHGMYLRKQRGEVADEDEKEKIKELQDVIRTMHLESHRVRNGDDGLYHSVADEAKQDRRIKDWMQPLPHLNPLLLALFGHILMIGLNYMGAIVFYMRAYARAPNDPLISLSLGIANLHRSTQRKTDNRHLQVIKGFQMLTHYCQLRQYNQEAEYNMGRAFHLLNLTHLAVHHYERVLVLPSAAKQGQRAPKSMDDIYTWPPNDMNDNDDDDDAYDETDLKREAAYNLHLIYMTSGATSLAQIVLMKYCSI